MKKERLTVADLRKLHLAVCGEIAKDDWKQKPNWIAEMCREIRSVIRAPTLDDAEKFLRKWCAGDHDEQRRYARGFRAEAKRLFKARAKKRERRGPR